MAKKGSKGNSGKAGSRAKKAAERKWTKRKEVVFGAAVGIGGYVIGHLAETALHPLAVQFANYLSERVAIHFPDGHLTFGPPEYVRVAVRTGVERAFQDDKASFLSFLETASTIDAEGKKSFDLDVVRSNRNDQLSNSILTELSIVWPSHIPSERFSEVRVALTNREENYVSIVGFL